jgi:GMP synthase-like glutamine amidotransferase
MLEQIQRVRQAVEAGMPYLGICLGLQVLVKAMGGSVVPSPIREVGFRDPAGESFGIELTEAGTRDPLLKGVSLSFKTCELHGEMVQIIPGMELLGTGKWCTPQIVKVRDRAYGFQCHFEFTEHLLKTLLQQDQDMLRLNPDNVQADFHEVKTEYQKTAKHIIQNFLSIAGLP